ncbi:MAG: hypothetical protein AAB421_02825 [Patescibacteria group bacterium]
MKFRALESSQTEVSAFSEHLKEQVALLVSEVTDQKPELWWRSAYRRLIELQRMVDAESPTEDLRLYAHEKIDAMVAVMRAQSGAGTQGEASAIQQAREVIHTISDLFMLEEKGREPTQVQHIPIGAVMERCNASPYGYKTTLEVTESGISLFKIFSPTRKEWFDFPIPPSDTMVHKGGFPRVILKILFNAPQDTIEAELPPNDFDVIAWGDESQAHKDGALIGVDPVGVEVVEVTPTGTPDFEKLLVTRDVTLNSCLLGMQGLFYSDKAVDAAQTGAVEPIPAFRGIYGASMFFYDGELLMNSRDMMRVLKFVVEGKASAFDFKDLNKQVDIGIYPLVLAQKFMKKPNAVELLNRMFFVLRQMGQTHEGEDDIWAVLHRAHEEYPFFALDRPAQDDAGVAKWLMEKLAKQALTVFRKDLAIPSGLELPRTPGDAKPKTVSLAGYTPRPETAMRDARELDWFRAESARRAAAAPPADLKLAKMLTKLTE